MNSLRYFERSPHLFRRREMMMAKDVSENELRAREALMLAAKRFDTHSGTSVSEQLVEAIDALIDVKVSERLAAVDLRPRLLP